MSYYVYILKSEKDGRYYKGISNDVERRLGEHNRGEEKYTSPYRPWKLLLVIEKANMKEAADLERKLKNLTRERLESFITKYS